MTDFHAQLERQLVDAGRRRASRGRVALAVAGRGRPLVALATVLLALMASVGLVSALRSSSSSGPGGSAAPSAPPAASSAPGATSPSAAEGKPSLQGIRVAVLNATTTTGLARSVADVLERHRASIDSIGTDADQQRAQSVVEHRPGAEAQGRLVAQVLRISDVRVLMSTNSTIPAADADVLVRLGADRRTP